jgi:hypothetical protein
VHGPGSYTEYFASVDNAVITADIMRIRKSMHVYRMTDGSHAQSEADSKPERSSVRRGAQQTNASKANNRLTTAFTHTVPHLGEVEQTPTSNDKCLQSIRVTDKRKLRRYAHECMMQVADIAQMIIYLSQVYN